jgi:hypothetical protein
MRTAMGVVEGGRIRLPDGVELPEGQPVAVEWDEDWARWGPPLEREPLTLEDVQHEIEGATGKRFQYPKQQ